MSIIYETAYVLVAGGLGERLGYKVFVLASNMVYLDPLQKFRSAEFGILLTATFGVDLNDDGVFAVFIGATP